VQRIVEILQKLFIWLFILLNGNACDFSLHTHGQQLQFQAVSNSKRSYDSRRVHG